MLAKCLISPLASWMCAQLAVSSLHVVWRCAIHWRQWARRRSLERRSATYAAQPSCVPAGGSSLGAREKRKDATSMPCLNGAVSVAESVQVTAKQDNVTRVARPVVSTRTRLGVDVPPPPAVASEYSALLAFCPLPFFSSLKILHISEY